MHMRLHKFARGVQKVTHGLHRGCKWLSIWLTKVVQPQCTVCTPFMSILSENHVKPLCNLLFRSGKTFFYFFFPNVANEVAHKVTHKVTQKFAHKVAHEVP